MRFNTLLVLIGGVSLLLSLPLSASCLPSRVIGEIEQRNIKSEVCGPAMRAMHLKYKPIQQHIEKEQPEEKTHQHTS